MTFTIEKVNRGWILTISFAHYSERTVFTDYEKLETTIMNYVKGMK